MSSTHLEASVAAVQARQRAVIDRLPAYTKWTSGIALGGLLITIVASLIRTHRLPDPLSLPAATDISIGSAISFGLTLVSNAMIWLFAVWSLSFASFIVLTSHKVARSFPDRPVQGRQFRWLQLYAATLLPIVLFATAWNSTTGPSVVIVPLAVRTMSDLLTLTLTAFGVGVLLFVIGRFIPIRYASTRLALISLLLYSTLLFSYRLGIGIASHAAVIGIFIYLATGNSHIGDLCRRLSIYDIADDVADNFDALMAREQGLQTRRDELELIKREQEHAYGLKMAEVVKQRLELNAKISEAQLGLIEMRIDNLTKAFAILTEEHQKQLALDLKARLDVWREEARSGLTTAELAEKIRIILVDAQKTIGVQEGLAELRTELKQAEEEMRQLFLTEGTPSDEHPPHRTE
jgi:hypothetical protein